MNDINLLDLINNYRDNLHTFLNKYLTGVGLFIQRVLGRSVTLSKATLIVLMERAIKHLILLKQHY